MFPLDHSFVTGDNIVLREDRQFHPVIIDFGKATQIGESKARYRLSKQDMLKWKKKYPWVAPELLSNADSPSAVTDVYSFGYCVKAINDRRPSSRLKEIVQLTYNVIPAKRASFQFVNHLLTRSVSS